MKRHWLCRLVIVVTALLVAGSFSAQAQPYPSKQIRIIVPAPPGGPSDMLARLIGEKLALRLKQQVVVENRVGAGGIIGFETASKAAPDGYTLVLGDILTLGVSSVRGHRYDPAKDFTPVSLVSQAPSILLVQSSLPANSVRELIALTKTKPDQIKFSSAGIGAQGAIALQQLRDLGGAPMLHVPYKGGADAATAFTGGQVEVTFASVPDALALARTGKARPLAVTGSARSSLAPELPTVAEAGVTGFNVVATYGVLLPAGAPREIVTRLNSEIAGIVNQPDMRERMARLGAEPVSTTPEQFTDFLRKSSDQWASVAKQIDGGFGVKGDGGSLPAVIPTPAPQAAGKKSEKKAAEKVAKEKPASSAAAAPPTVAAAAPSRASAMQLTPRSAEGELRWNAWGENEMVPYLPVTRIESRTNYRVRVHLAPFSYGPADAGVASPTASKSMKTTLKQWLKTVPLEQHTIELDALLIYDSSYFERPPTTRKALTINLDRVREFDKGAVAQVSNPLPRLRRDAKQPFVLGEAEFQLRTKPVLPQREGGAAVAISLWDRSKQMPLDEISFALCAHGEVCKGVRSASYGFDGFDALKICAGAKLLRPAAAIHLVELQSGELFGVLRRQGDGAYYTWPLRSSLRDFQKLISSQLKHLQSANGTEAQRAIIGDALLEQFFPSALDNPDGQDARKQFVGLAREQMKEKPYPSDELPAVFFRIAAVNSTEPSLWPISLIAISRVDAAAGSAPASDFLGRYFRIESPLTNQNYEPSTPCLDEWVVIGPADVGATRLARAQLNDRFVVGDDYKPRALRVKGAPQPVTVVDDMDAFLKFIRGPVGNEEAPESKRPTLLSVLSHHDRNAVYFDGSTTKVLSGNVRRNFFVPSAAILNGCGTGESGASDFIDKLNARGVHAAVATITEVEPAMAGDFLECFIEQVESAPAGGIAIGVAHTKALRCLEQKGPYGSRALFYSLLGNSGLKICKPRIDP